MISFFSNQKNLALTGAIVIIVLIIGAFLLVNTTSESGQKAVAGDHVFVHYTGKLSNGDVFDSSINKDPIDFVLGTGAVISGWDTGILGMKVGERKTLVIPPEKGYGSEPVTDNEGNVVIPANSTLTFDVLLIKIERP